MTHTISFRRPELHHELSKMSVPPPVNVGAQIRRLRALGYQIIDVRPPLIFFGPGNMMVGGAPRDSTDPSPYARAPDWRKTHDAESSASSNLPG